MPRKLPTLLSLRTGLRYKLLHRLGEGGFGETWKAVPKKGNHVHKPVCLKMNWTSVPWHRECYFGEILQKCAGAIQMSDEFVAAVGRKIAYCSVFELARGSVSDHRPEWTTADLLRQFRHLTEAVAELHRMGAVHRDITPMNALLSLDGRRLILADFGIALHGVGRPVKADCFNVWHAPDSAFRERANWEPRDDVWQLGQLLAFLLDASVEGPIERRIVHRLNCSDHAKALIYRSIAPREHRLQNADRLLEIWDSPDVSYSRAGRISGKNIVFTGKGSFFRDKLERLARRAGATPQEAVAWSTDLLVVGATSPIWAAGSKGGRKILAAIEQQDRGSPIRIITEEAFLKAMIPQRC